MSSDEEKIIFQTAQRWGAVFRIIPRMPLRQDHGGKDVRFGNADSMRPANPDKIKMCTVDHCTNGVQWHDTVQCVYQDQIRCAVQGSGGRMSN